MNAHALSGDRRRPDIIPAAQVNQIVMQEIPQYLGPPGDRVFAVLHRTDNPNGHGVVLCAPLGEEMLWSRRVLVTFARELAASGYTVLRFDYRGEGDSDRWFEESSVSTRVEDTQLATGSLRAMVPAVEGITLVGLRFGSVIAAAMAADRSDVNRLVLWDPVLDGSDYMQGFLRLNLMYQMALYHKVIENREQLAARLASGGTVNIEGYELGRQLYDEACSFNLGRALDRFDGPVQLVSIAPRPMQPRPALEALAGARPQVTISSVTEEPFWREIKTFYQRAPELFAATLSWLGDRT